MHIRGSFGSDVFPRPVDFSKSLLGQSSSRNRRQNFFESISFERKSGFNKGIASD